jgi:hypothetical protein
VLLFLKNYEQGYASVIARIRGISPSQLRKFGDAGVLVGKSEGTTLNYWFKPGPFADALPVSLSDMLRQLAAFRPMRITRKGAARDCSRVRATYSVPIFLTN